MIRLFPIALPALAASALWCAATASHAAPSQASTDQVTASLLPSHDQVRPGDRLTIGVHQKIIPHWHTYWQNPGDSGVATGMAWTLPKGSQASTIQWPIPKRFNIGPVTNFGYEDAVTLLSEVEVPKDAKPGEGFTVLAKVNWLVCQEVCIPQKVELGLTLPIVASGTPLTGSHPLIDQARTQLPTRPAWAAQAQAAIHGKQVALRFPAQALTAGAKLKEAWFYPHEWGPVAPNAAQPALADAASPGVLLSVGESPGQPGQALNGVLVLTEQRGREEVRRGFTIGPVLAAGTSQAPATQAVSRQEGASASHEAAQQEDLALGPALVLAFLGGLILNLMPCVFPVLSIKALSLLSHSTQSARQTRLQGVAYTAGVLASFALLAALLLALKAAGSQVGWGFQFQSPVFVLVVAYLMLAVGLNLSGVFAIGHSVTGLGASLADRSGYTGSFFTGVLATVVATPCTAPFMGGAIGFALAQPAPVLLAVFLSLGLGLAAPYLLLSWWPALQRWLPRPGAWMERFKQFLAFPMYAAAAWLVWVLAQQAGINAAGTALLGMVGIGFAAWVYEITRQSPNPQRYAGNALALISLAIALVGGHVAVEGGSPNGGALGTAQAAANGKDWEPYTPDRLDALRAQGKPVFLNLTAAWCITCLANERVALRSGAVPEAFKAQGITYLKGDWTNQDPAITKVLQDFGRSGVPLYVYYPPGPRSQAVVLPQILTPDTVLSALKDANSALSSTQH